MITIELFPTKTKCIESTAKGAYNELMRQYLSSNPAPPDSEDKIELLAGFLNTANFKKLRRESEPLLLRGENVVFTIYNDGAGIRYSMKTC